MAKPLKRCNASGCRKLIPYDDKFCKEHQGADYKAYNKERQRTNAEYIAFYHTKGWKELRAYKLSIDPLCEPCLAKDTEHSADMVHHKIEVSENWDLRLSLENLESVRRSCHNKIEHKNKNIIKKGQKTARK